MHGVGGRHTPPDHDAHQRLAALCVARRRQLHLDRHRRPGFGRRHGCAHYCASQFGVVGLTNSLAVELGEFGIRVNSVHPYGTDTLMGNDLSMYKVFGDHPHYIHSFSPGALPTDSLADPDLISDIVVWLASDASSLVTAAQIPADKGYLKI